jgi:ankyrin repeat protein
MLANQKTVHFLLDPESAIGQQVNVDLQNYCQYTPLMIACTNSHTNIIQILLSHQASVNKENQVGMTPLHAACLSGNIKAVDMLLN